MLRLPYHRFTTARCCAHLGRRSLALQSCRQLQPNQEFHLIPFSAHTSSSIQLDTGYPSLADRRYVPRIRRVSP